MSLWFIDVLATWRHDLQEKSDPRVRNWPLMGDPVPVLLISLFYALMCWGGMGRALVDWLVSRFASAADHCWQWVPRLLRAFMLFYNAVMVALSFYMFTEFISVAALGKYSFWCQPVDDRPDSKNGLRAARVCWLYFYSKVIELLDTAFIIVKRKSEISFLHVYHHFSMMLTWWAGANYVPGGQSVYSACVNCLVHTFMYSYYGCTCLVSDYGSSKRHSYKLVRSLVNHCKRYVTLLQLGQFYLIILHTGYCYLFVPCPGYPQGFNIAICTYLSSLVILFTHFYINTYRQAASRRHLARASHQQHTTAKGVTFNHDVCTNGSMSNGVTTAAMDDEPNNSQHQHCKYS